LTLGLRDVYTRDSSCYAFATGARLSGLHTKDTPFALRISDCSSGRCGSRPGPFGIVLVYLERTGRAVLVRWVWGGVAAAAAASLAAAVALERWRVSQDGFEGLLLLIAAVFVITVIVWMNRVAHHLKNRKSSNVWKAMQEGVLSLQVSAWPPLVFFMVLREGAELALILRGRGAFQRGAGSMDRQPAWAWYGDCRWVVLLPGDVLRSLLEDFSQQPSTILISCRRSTGPDRDS